MEVSHEKAPPAAAAGYGGASAGRPSSAVQLLGYILRGLSVALLLIAAIVMGTAKQTKIIGAVNPITGDVISASVTAKSTYSSAFVYFVVANVIACFYSIVSLVLAFANKLRSSGIQLLLALLDVLIVALMFSSIGAAIQFGVLAKHGNSHAGWSKFCNVVGKFCGQVTAAIVLSTLASIAYLLLVMLGIIAIHKKSY